MGLEANIWKLRLWQLARGASFFFAVIVPFVTERGVSVAEFFTLQAIMALVIVALEIPSGYFSDVYGRKASMIIASLAGTIGIGFYAFGHSFLAFAIGEAIIGVGISFSSGAKQAFLYETMTALGRGEEHVKEKGRVELFRWGSEGVTSVIGGLLASVFLALPAYFALGAYALMIPLSLSFVEPPRKKRTSKHLSHLLDIFLETLHRDRRLVWLVAFYTLAMLAIRVSGWAAQPLFIELGIPLSLFGVLWATMLLLSGGSSFLAHRVDARAGRVRGLWLIVLVGSIGFLTAGLVGGFVALAGVVLIQLARGLVHPFVDDETARMVSDDRRSTVFSIMSMFNQLLYGVVMLFAGALVEQDVFLLYTVLGGFLLVAGGLSLAGYLAQRSL